MTVTMEQDDDNGVILKQVDDDDRMVLEQDGEMIACAFEKTKEKEVHVCRRKMIMVRQS